MLEVVYEIRETGVQLRRVFDSEYLCRKFVNKVRHSKKVALISCPSFRW